MEPELRTRQPGPGGAPAFLVVSALSFGTLAIFGKLAYRAGINVQTLLSLRFLLAGTMLVLLMWLRGLPWPRGRTLAGLALMGGVGYVGQSAAYFNSLRYVPAAVTAVLLYTYPAMVTLAGIPLFGERLGRLRATALALALLGAYLVASPAGGVRWEGVALGLLAAVLYSAYILAGKRVMEGAEPISATAVICLAAGAAYGAFTLATGSATLPHDAPGWLAVIGLALVATVIGAAAFLAGLRRTTAGTASLISTLEPVSTAVLAAVVFGETLLPGQLVGGGLVLVAVVLVSRGRRQEPLPARE